MAKSPLSGALEQQVSRALEATTAIMLKYFLRQRGLTAGMNDSKDAVVARIWRYIKNGDLDAADMVVASTRLLEYSNKRVYLFHAAPKALAKLNPATLPKRISDPADAAIARLPPSPLVNYSWFDGTLLRVSMAETHLHPVADYQNRTSDLIPTTKVVVMATDVQTGFTAIFLDPPERFNPHSAGLGYYAFYQGRAEQILGTRLDRIVLHKALEELEATDLVRIPHSRAKTASGYADLTSLDAEEESRKMDVYAGVAAHTKRRDGGRYIWLVSPKATCAGVFARRGEQLALLREVPSEIHAATGLVRFTKTCVEEEIEYVLGQLRAHS